MRRTCISILLTPWVVLRAMEYLRIPESDKATFDRTYELWRVVDQRAKIAEVAWLPGRDFLLYDAYFTVWRRRPGPVTSP